MDNITEKEYFIIKSDQSSFQFTLSNLQSDKTYSHVVVSSAAIPKTYYVLPKDAILYVTTNTGTWPVTFPKGNYSVFSFPTLFNKYVTEQKNINYSFAVTFPNSNSEVQTSKFRFEAKTPPTQPTFLINDVYLARVMGFDETVPQTFVGNVLYSPNVVNFQSYDEILIKSDMVQNQAGLLQEIYSAAYTYNSSILWNNPSIQINAKKLKTSVTNTYRFSLLDEQNNTIDLNGSEWSFILCVFKTSDFEDIVKKEIEIKLLQQQQQNLLNE